MARHHPENHPSTQEARSLLHTATSCWPEPGDNEKRVAKRKAQLEQLKRRQPQMLRASALMFGDLCKLATEKYHLSGWRSNAVPRSIMKKHAAAHERKGASSKRTCGKRAWAVIETKRGEVAEQRRRLVQELRPRQRSDVEQQRWCC